MAFGSDEFRETNRIREILGSAQYSLIENLIRITFWRLYFLFGRFDPSQFQSVIITPFFQSGSIFKIESVFTTTILYKRAVKLLYSGGAPTDSNRRDHKVPYRKEEQLWTILSDQSCSKKGESAKTLDE
uniref:Pex N-terminal domain-containing protein n=1 Tax=Angiostrongylus cantonensis TaxID=6313 RepID=A0A0K0DBX4_ANGCA